MRNTTTLLAAGLLLASTLCGQISPASISGSGTYFNDAGLIIDGYTPPQYTVWTDVTTTYWTGFETSFTVDLGAAYHLTDIAWSVDNNDSYAVEWSLDGVAFNPLLTVGIGDGDVAVFPGGMDTMSSFLGDAEYVAAMDFAMVDARYLRLLAVEGDALNAIGEITPYGRRIVDGTPVPEPSTYGMIAAGALLAVIAGRRLRSRGN